MIGYYDESVFKDFIKEAASEFPNLPIKYLREYQALGTAGGLYHFRDAILKGRPERIFVLNSDVCCSFPLVEMAKLFDDKDAEAVILVTVILGSLEPCYPLAFPRPWNRLALHATTSTASADWRLDPVGYLTGVY